MCAFERSEKGMDFIMDNEKKIPVVNGDGKLDISPVSDNLEVEKPTEKKEGETIIPTNKK